MKTIYIRVKGGIVDDVLIPPSLQDVDYEIIDLDDEDYYEKKRHWDYVEQIHKEETLNYERSNAKSK